jgi:hypothetical protein
MGRRAGRWLALAVLAPLALASLSMACGTLLGIEPDPPTLGADGGEGGTVVDATSDGTASGDAPGTDGGSDACADGGCEASTCGAGGLTCPLAGGGSTCVDAQLDDQNCGGCGHVCNIAGSCVAGDCARRVFVTRDTYAVGGSNTLRNLDAADTFCQGIASARGLKNTFRAWMSDSGQYPANGARFTQTARPYQLMNGTIVASSFGGLMSGTLLAAISVDESGAPALGMAWTGTRVDGQRAPNASCTGWSDGNSMISAAAGLVTATDMTWTEGSLSCASTAHLYCFEQ